MAGPVFGAHTRNGDAGPDPRHAEADHDGRRPCRRVRAARTSTSASRSRRVELLVRNYLTRTTTLTGKGYDKRGTPDGVMGNRNISLVAGGIAIARLVGAADQPTPEIMSMLLPEPGANLQMVAGVSALLVIAAWRPRRARQRLANHPRTPESSRAVASPTMCGVVQAHVRAVRIDPRHRRPSPRAGVVVADRAGPPAALRGRPRRARADGRAAPRRGGRAAAAGVARPSGGGAAQADHRPLGLAAQAVLPWASRSRLRTRRRCTAAVCAGRCASRARPGIFASPSRSCSRNRRARRAASAVPCAISVEVESTVGHTCAAHRSRRAAFVQLAPPTAKHPDRSARHAVRATVRMSARVCWRSRSDSPSWRDRGMGVAFEAIDAESLARAPAGRAARRFRIAASRAASIPGRFVSID